MAFRNAMGKLLCAGVVMGCAAMAVGQTPVAAAPAPVRMRAEVPLWAGGAPGSEGKTGPEVVTLQNSDGEHAVTDINNPSLTPYVVRGTHAPAAAVIIAPGGGHSLLSIDHEGYDVAKFLSGHGVVAFVLKYRLAKAKGSTYTVDLSLIHIFHIFWR